jgi:hypothetical protein
MIFWLVLKIEISSRVINILKHFGFNKRILIFLRLYFLRGEIFEFS